MADNLRQQFMQLIDEVGEIKTAAVKVATPISEPGGLDGASSHPSAKVDDGTQVATTGARAAENEADVKAQIGKPSVDSTPEATPGANNQNDAQLNIGTKQRLSGDDPAVEDNYKDTKDEPGNLEGKSTTSPATVGDEKFATLSLPEKHTALTKLANELLADILVDTAGKGSNTSAQAPAARAAAQSGADHVAAGYKAAAAAGTQISEADVNAFLQEQIKHASDVADRAGAYLVAYFKRAMDADDANAAEDHNNPGDEKSGNASNESATAGPAAGGGAPGGEDLALLQAMGGDGGGAPGGDAGGPLGGPAGGAMPPDAAPGGAAPGGINDVNELFNALLELGITPEQLQALAAQAETGGGAPPAMGPKIAAVKQAAHTVRDAALRGNTWVCEAKTAGQKRARADYKAIMGDFVRRLQG